MSYSQIFLYECNTNIVCY